MTDLPFCEASPAPLLYLLVGSDLSLPCLRLSGLWVVTVLSAFPHRDYTDNDLDGGEVENASRSRSFPPIPSATSCLDSHFGQDQLAIESTGNFLPFCLPQERSSPPLHRSAAGPSFCLSPFAVIQQLLFSLYGVSVLAGYGACKGDSAVSALVSTDFLELAYSWSCFRCRGRNGPWHSQSKRMH